MAIRSQKHHWDDEKVPAASSLSLQKHVDGTRKTLVTDFDYHRDKRQPGMIPTFLVLQLPFNEMLEVTGWRAIPVAISRQHRFLSAIRHMCTTLLHHDVFTSISSFSLSQHLLPSLYLTTFRTLFLLSWFPDIA